MPGNNQPFRASIFLNFIFNTLPTEKNYKIFLSPPHIGDNELRYIHDAFEENWIAPLGPNVNKFENAIENYLGENVYVRALNSGTAALHLALIILGVAHGDEVICQSFTFSASANPIVYQGATPIFIDSENETWNMSPEYLEKAIKSRLSNGVKPKAIILVHLYGMPAKLNEIMAISKKYGIPVIEDAAEALGSTYMGKPLGTFGDIGIFSFNGNKIITTSGGGAIISSNKEYIDQAFFLATQAKDPQPYYQHSHIGYNYRLSNICAGIGLGQMEVLNERVARRRYNYDYYKSKLAHVGGISFLEEENGSFCNRWLTTIIIDPASNTSPEHVADMMNQESIESRPLWKPMHLQPIFKDCEYWGETVSEDLFKYGICLPSGSNLTDQELDHVIKVILNIFQLCEI